jgi:hypothetical protein
MSDSLQPPPKYVVFKRVDRLGHGEALENSIRINGVLYRLIDLAEDREIERLRKALFTSSSSSPEPSP